MTPHGRRTLAALALQVAALAALATALLGGAWLDTRRLPRVLVLVDRSQSMQHAAADQALAEVARSAQGVARGEWQWLVFAGQPAAPAPRPGGTGAHLQPSTTNIEAALQAALAAHAQAAFDRLVVLSDGQENQGDAARGLRAAHEAGLPVHWLAVGRPPPASRIDQLLAPDRATPGQPIALSVQLSGDTKAPLRVVATARAPGGQTLTSRGDTDAQGRATLSLVPTAPGAVIVDLRLEDPAAGQALDALPDAAVVDVAPRAAMLYVQGSPGPLAGSLARGGWGLTVVPAARLDVQTDGLDAYQAVVLDDVAITDAGPRFWRALVTAVQQRGLGLVVLGGERAFARGGYRDSMLETILPVRSEPAALDQPVSVLFTVDKSGSMGQGSGGVDRFALAQRAVLETARGLTDRDALGLLVFDVAPRWLLPIGPAPAGVTTLARDWPASPNGGTQLAPALSAAIESLARAPAGRRLLVLVTDGFVDDRPLAELRARLDRAQIETIALAVGPDADADALARLFGTDSGLVLRVDQAAELPQIMRSGLERRRARVARGQIAVTQVQPLPFAPGRRSDWPTIAAHAVTRAQPQAVVAVQSERGEPLIAYQSAGRGRVLAVTTGLGAWTPRWLAWPAWPSLAGGLADWAGGTARDGAVALRVTDTPAALQIDADVPSGLDAGDAGSVRIAVDTPTSSGQALAVDRVAGGRLRATLPDAGPGLYTFIVSTPRGAQRHLHLRRQRAEAEAVGTNPALDGWRAAGLITPWRPDLPSDDRTRQRKDQPVDRSLIGLALALFLAGVGVDRMRPTVAGLRAVVASALARWRRPA